MKISQRTIFQIVIFVAAAVAFLAAPGFSGGHVFEAKQAASDNLSIKTARIMPISNWLITMSISGKENGGSFEISQLEGGLIRIEKSQGAVYGFSPVISDLTTRTVTIKVYRISQEKDASGSIEERLNEVYALVADKTGPTYYTDAEASFKIQIHNIEMDSNLTKDVLITQGDLRLLDNCCIRCDGDKTCACRVTSACGGCCNGPCCN